MATPQLSIFAVGTAAHCYLEYDVAPGVSARAAVTAAAGALQAETAVSGVNIVVGLRPELLAQVVDAAELIPGIHGFDQPLVGPDGFTMPATQHDAFVWISGAAADIVFDVAAQLNTELVATLRLASDVTGWPYRHNRDLTGFEDGTENPTPLAARELVIQPAGQPGAGSSVLLVQQWSHDFDAWQQLSQAEQENVIGRSKPDSIEMDDDIKPATSHVARSVIDSPDGELKIYRRNSPYGTASDHGTMFIGFSVEQGRLHRMLARMAGVEDGIRDALTRYATPLTGSYYLIPALETLQALAPPPSDDD